MKIQDHPPRVRWVVKAPSVCNKVQSLNAILTVVRRPALIYMPIIVLKVETLGLYPAASINLVILSASTVFLLVAYACIRELYMAASGLQPPFSIALQTTDTPASVTLGLLVDQRLGRSKRNEVLKERKASICTEILVLHFQFPLTDSSH